MPDKFQAITWKKNVDQDMGGYAMIRPQWVMI